MTCPHCTAGLPRSWGEHFRITERGVAKVGHCLDPDATPGEMKPDRFRARLAAWVERIHAPAVAAVLAPVNPNAPTHWQDEEETDDR